MFARSHCKRTLSHRLLLFPNSGFPRFQSLVFETSASFGDKFSVEKLTNPFKYPLWIHRVLGSINSLLCVILVNPYAHYQEFCIWNPSIRFIQTLPKPGFLLQYYGRHFFSYWGFGYVSATDDYKVLVANDRYKYCGKESFEMFSLRSNCWKQIEDPRLSIWNNRCLCSQNSGSLSNEALHWLLEICSAEDRTTKSAILAFDLANEKFREVPLPMLNNNGNEQVQFMAQGLGVLFGGCLSITYRELRQFSSVLTTVWVMISCTHLPRQCIFEPMVYEGNGTIVVKSKKNDSSDSFTEFIRSDHKEERLDKAVLCACGRDMLLVIEDKQNPDNFVVCNGRYRSDMPGVIQYDESLMKFQL